MNLWRLECFVVLASELHFGHTARRLHMSQPALSSQIKLLEEEIGAPLFHRSGTVRLTRIGDALLPEATAILSSVEAMAEHARVLTGRVVGRLNVLFTRSVLATKSLDIVQRFERAHPDVQVVMQSQWTAYNVDALREGRADVGFVRLPLDAAAGLNVVPLGQDEQVLVVPVGHRLAGVESIGDADLFDEDLITWRRDDAPGNFAALHSRWTDGGPTFAAELPDVAHRLARAATTGSLTLVSDFVVADLPATLVARPLTPPLLSEWGLAWPADTTNSLVSRFVRIAAADEGGGAGSAPPP